MVQIDQDLGEGASWDIGQEVDEATIQEQVEILKQIQQESQQ